ncbi:MAG: hypothetical protein KGN34_12800 [Sphingomonadales bacterium]|nr:hypothetical protein [Sphingomonadales bacterium]
MFGPRLNTVFASRWKALAWSASVLLTAYCTIPSASEGGDSKDAEQAAKMVAGLLPGAQPAPEPSHSPWAADKPAAR